MVLQARAVSRATPIVTSRGAPKLKGRCARDALPHTYDIGVFKTVKKNSTIIKYIYNLSENIVDGCNVALTPMIARISYERCLWLAWRVWWHALSFVTHKITWRSLIKSAAIEKLMPFPAKIHTAML